MEHVSDRPTPELVDDDEYGYRVRRYKEDLPYDLNEIDDVVAELANLNALQAIISKALTGEAEEAGINLRELSLQVIENRANSLANSDDGVFTENDTPATIMDIETILDNAAAELRGARKTKLERRYGV